MAKSSNKTVTKKIATKPRASATEGDDTAITAFALPPEPLSPEMAAYFEKCEEKLGFVPNVLKAYAFDNAKLAAFVAMYNDLMLAPSGLSKLEREMIAVAVSSHNRCYYCLVAHGAAVRALSGDPALGELMVMNYRAARLSPRERAMLDFAVKLTAEPWSVEDEDRAALRRAGFGDRDIWDIAAVAGFFNMSNRSRQRPTCGRTASIMAGPVNGSRGASETNAEGTSGAPVAFGPFKIRALGAVRKQQQS
jgi:uncharacterized peroxidase-related enzyme